MLKDACSVVRPWLRGNPIWNCDNGSYKCGKIWNFKLARLCFYSLVACQLFLFGTRPNEKNPSFSRVARVLAFISWKPRSRNGDSRCARTDRAWREPRRLKYDIWKRKWSEVLRCCSTEWTVRVRGQSRPQSLSRTDILRQLYPT